MRKSLGSAADVLVVGGGVAGLSAARSLARRGVGVTLVEARAAGAGASNAAAGMLAPQAEADRADELFRLLCASRDLYPDFAAALLGEAGVDIELERTGTLYLALDERDEEEAARRFAWQSRAGLAVERLTTQEARSLEPEISPRVRSALRFPRDWQVENRRLVGALRASAESFGARVLEGVRALGVTVEAGRAVGVETGGGRLAAGAVVLAAGAWSSQLEGTPPGPRFEPVRGQVLCFRHGDSQTPFVRHVVYGARGYLVPRRGGRLLAGSTTERAGFDCRVTEEGLAAVRAQAEEIAPGVSALALADSWAGLRPRAADGLPVIGESADVRGLFYAAGYYRNGILLAPAAGEILADLVTAGRTTLLPAGALSTFSPARFDAALAGSRAV